MCVCVSAPPSHSVFCLSVSLAPPPPLIVRVCVSLSLSVYPPHALFLSPPPAPLSLPRPSLHQDAMTAVAVEWTPMRMSLLDDVTELIDVYASRRVRNRIQIIPVANWGVTTALNACLHEAARMHATFIAFRYSLRAGPRASHGPGGGRPPSDGNGSASHDVGAHSARTILFGLCGLRHRIFGPRFLQPPPLPS